jgi:hypothetical protein
MNNTIKQDRNLKKETDHLQQNQESKSKPKQDSGASFGLLS